MATVLVVDDEVMNRNVARKILTKEGHEVLEAENGAEALQRLEAGPVDLVLMDLMMPVMDGFEATSRIKGDPRFTHIPLIVISALSDRQAIKRGLALGADEYLSKPFDIEEFVLRVGNAVKLSRYNVMLQDQNRLLETVVEEKTHELQQALRELEQTEYDIIELLGKTAEFRDNETSAHTIRVGKIASLLASKLGWTPEQAELMRLAAPMHDIGKVGIPDHILLKPGRLDEVEFEQMKRHTVIGYEILQTKRTPLLELAAEIAISHHEKFDGSGYPQGYARDMIPMSGRIVAVADVFDALTSIRPYKQAFEIEEAARILKEGSGSHFDPAVVGCFFNHYDEVVQIMEEHTDA